MQPLFLEPTLDFEKSAAQTQLPEDPNAWPHEVLQELYKQAPYIADFAPHVVMEKVDGEQGYGLGHVEVGNQTEIQTAASPEMSAAAGVRQVRVPVIIKDGMLQPFDLLVSDDAKVLPLTEVRLRAAIFRPQSFDVTSRTPGDQSMIGQLYPPYRQNMGFGGGGTTMNVGMGKEGSALEAFLTPETEKTAGAFQDFGDQFLDADYLHAAEGTRQSRGGKKMASGDHAPGALDDFISKNAAAMTREKAERLDALGTGGMSAVGTYAINQHTPLKRRAAFAAGVGATAGLAQYGAGRAIRHFSDKRKAKQQAEAATKEGSALGNVQKALRGAAPKKALENAASAKSLAGSAQRRASSVLKAMKKTGSVLEAILPTINEEHRIEFMQAIGDPELRPALFKNAAAVTPSIQLIMSAQPRAKLASALPYLVQPSVVQLKRVEEGYRVKAASHLYWEPFVSTIDRGEALARFGEKVVLAADLSGAMTMADGAEAMEPVPEQDDADLEGAMPVTEPGIYRVRTPDGEELTGFVIPNLVDVDGTSIPLSLFANGERATVQTDIVGVPSDEEPLDLPTADVPRGRGVFATSDGPNGPQATVPLDISATLAGVGSGEPMSYRAESFSGEDILVSQQPNIQAVVGTDDGKMLVPDSWVWVPLDKAQPVAVESKEDGLKMASVMRDLDSVQLVSGGGGTFSVRGSHVEKLAHDEREMLGIDDAMFLLAALGVEQTYGATKIAEAHMGLAPVRVRVGREIKLASDERAEATERAAEVLAYMPQLRQPLFKEAAVIGDPSAVDTVLALGFLNPENLMTFVSYLPVLEDAQGKLCDILLASRLGNLIETPEGAIERSVRSTEAVLEGLKALAFQNN
jgi:hypothetical protein